MKLAILVIYKPISNFEQLFSVHISNILDKTEGDFTVYAGGVDLNENQEKLICENQRVKYIKLKEPETGHLAPSREHSFYLEQIIPIAISDENERISIFHLDSFPIVKGWNRRLDKILSPQYPLAIPIIRNLEGPYTAAMYFLSSFYKEHKPRLIDNGPDCKKFIQSNGMFMHSGSGFLWKLSQCNLNWKVLKPGKQRLFYAGDIHSGIIFHLRGSVRNQISMYTENSRFTAIKILILYMLRLLWVDRLLGGRLSVNLRNYRCTLTMLSIHKHGTDFIIPFLRKQQ